MITANWRLFLANNIFILAVGVFGIIMGVIAHFAARTESRRTRLRAKERAVRSGGGTFREIAREALEHDK